MIYPNAYQQAIDYFEEERERVENEEKKKEPSKVLSAVFNVFSMIGELGECGPPSPLQLGQQEETTPLLNKSTSALHAQEISSQKKIESIEERLLIPSPPSFLQFVQAMKKEDSCTAEYLMHLQVKQMERVRSQEIFEKKSKLPVYRLLELKTQHDLADRLADQRISESQFQEKITWADNVRKGKNPTYTFLNQGEREVLIRHKFDRLVKNDAHPSDEERHLEKAALSRQLATQPLYQGLEPGMRMSLASRRVEGGMNERKMQEEASWAKRILTENNQSSPYALLPMEEKRAIVFLVLDGTIDRHANFLQQLETARKCYPSYSWSFNRGEKKKNSG
ncbi:MAG: hypothetical protein ACH350_07675 [Parachlamydiaceae bacterium]